MRLPLIPMLIVIVLSVLLDIYIYRNLHNATRKKYLGYIHIAVSAVAILAIVGVLAAPKRNCSNANLLGLMWVLFSFISIYVPKIIYFIFDLVGNIPRLFHRRRWKSFRVFAAILAFVSFCAIWWGALINRFNINVNRVEVPIKDLPIAFDGFTIAQISDLHLGTYGDDTSFPAAIIDSLKQLSPDMIVFTGDIVNRRTDELHPFVETLSNISAPYGIYSILGNHDYGDYCDWPSDETKQQNLQELIDLENQMGWKMLNNVTAYIHVAADSIALIGVENVGDPPFHTYGDLDKAYQTLDDSVVKILLSHNPAHWVDDICDSPDKNIALTLSGHTHAMQMAFGRVSPAIFRYKTWGGMYNDNENHSLYVNIGLGTVGYPARIGATPEITLFTLKSK
jgi:predicted MPP superfamily phosphohydrolase